MVDRSQIVSGGPAPDVIASIDEPRFEAAEAIDWLVDTEPVLVIDRGPTVRAYPVQILIWHEIVNDVIDGLPVVVTYCPLCNSAVAFEREHQGELLDFGTSGSLYQSALVMYDRQTESLWTHFDGRAVIGDRIGQELTRVAVSTVSFGDLRRGHPGAEVLIPPATSQPYGRNPYGAYDGRERPLSGFFPGAIDPRTGAMDRVVGIKVGDTTVAITLDRLRRDGVVPMEIDGRRAVAWVAPGLRSALGTHDLVDGEEIGASGVFWTDRHFSPTAAGFSDDDGLIWDVLGRPRRPAMVEGDDASDPAPLEPVIHLDTFWFAWSAYHPETELIE